MVFVWIGLIVLAVIAEATTEQLVSIWFVGGGIAGLILSILNVDPLIQILVVVAVSLILLIAIRPFARKKLDFEKTGTNADRNIGKTGVVLEDISNKEEHGQVKVLGNIWTARSALGDDIIMKDTEVNIIRIEGVRLIVEPKQ